MNDWKEYKLGEIAKTNKKSIGRDFPYSRILYLDTGSITCNKIQELQAFDLKDAPSRAKRIVFNEDIIYSTVRPNQLHYGFIVNPQENLVVSTGFVTIACNQKIVLPKFLYYNIIHPQTTEYLHSIAEASTSAYPSLKPSDLEAIDILLPPLHEQKQIAGILSSLDDKIDLLNRQNRTLEQMAETLFRQWFVEDAKDDWEEGKLGDITDVAIGRTPPRKETHWFSENPNDIKWVSIKDMGNDGVFIFQTSEYLHLKTVQNFKIPIIPQDTVILSFKMTVGRVAITTENMVSNEAIAQFKFNSNTPFSKEYLYLSLKRFEYDILGSTSSIVTAINSAMIKDIKISIPDVETMSKFNEKAKVMFDKIKTNQTQIQTLTKLRDTLLPKLMSGEVRVCGRDVAQSVN